MNEAIERMQGRKWNVTHRRSLDLPFAMLADESGLPLAVVNAITA